MFSWYKYLIVSLVFSHLGFWSGSLFLIAPLPYLCLLVLFPCVFKKKSRLFVASMCVKKNSQIIRRRRVGCLQFPGVFKKESRLFAASLCVQEEE